MAGGQVARPGGKEQRWQVAGESSFGRAGLYLVKSSLQKMKKAKLGGQVARPGGKEGRWQVAR